MPDLGDSVMLYSTLAVPLRKRNRLLAHGELLCLFDLMTFVNNHILFPPIMIRLGNPVGITHLAVTIRQRAWTTLRASVTNEVWCRLDVVLWQRLGSGTDTLLSSFPWPSNTQ